MKSFENRNDLFKYKKKLKDNSVRAQKAKYTRNVGNNRIQME